MKSFNSKKPFRVLSTKRAFSGKLVRLDVLQIKTASGRTYERELIRHRGAVVIIPCTPDGRLVLVRQLRVAVGEVIYEFPAGTLERGETPVRCAHRELIEETGRQAGRLRRLLEFYPTPGISTEKMFLFAADGLKKAKYMEPDLDEELEVVTLTPSQVERLIHRGQIIDGKTLLGFLFYQKYFR